MDSLQKRKIPVMNPSLDEILSFQHPELMERLKDKLHLSHEKALELFEDTKRFLYLGATHSSPLAPPPTIDDCWHEFMMYSRDYAEFCELHFGHFLHHQPESYLEKTPLEELRQLAKETRSLALKTFGTLSDNWTYNLRVNTQKMDLTSAPHQVIGAHFPFKLRTRARKLALYSRDRIDLDRFANKRAHKAYIEQAPFPHLVIDDFLKPDAYRELSEKFDDIKSRGFIEEQWGNDYFHRFEVEYDGYVYTPLPTLDPANPLSLFFSLEWNWLFSKLFRQFTTFETTIAFHHHPAGDRTGFVHHDSADKPFSLQMELPNGVIYGDGAPPRYASRRKIALLYFLNNDGWREGDGGEIGLYAADGKSLTKKVAPLNNRLLAFQISPASMHAFQGNVRERNSIVQWFHAPGELT